jgi:hypothetical protein
MPRQALSRQGIQSGSVKSSLRNDLRGMGDAARFDSQNAESGCGEKMGRGNSPINPLKPVSLLWRMK